MTTQSFSVPETDWIDVTTEQRRWDMKISLRHFTEQKYFMYSSEGACDSDFG